MIRALTSASNLARRAACPGSERLEAGLVEEESEEAKIGTLLHSYYSNPRLDRSFLTPRNRELLRISEICDERILARVAEQFPHPQGGRESRAGETWWVKRDEDNATPGHTDRWLLWNTVGLMVIIDQKFGFKEVTPAESNYQLRCYACGGAEKFPSVESVVVAIVQPRLPFEQRITMACYDRDDIALARDEIFAIRDASRDPDAPLVPGPEQCRYCKARLICPALREQMGNAFALVPTVTGTVEKRKADAREILARCSDEDLDRMIQFVRMAGFVKDMALDEGRKRKEAGGLEMYELHDGTSPRYIADPYKAAAIMVLAGGMDNKAVWNCASMSIGKLEESVAERNKITLKEARRIIEEALADVIEREERKPSLVRKA